MTIAVEMTEVSKKFGSSWAINSISLEIELGETSAILGPNGAGKTTLMKVIATHISPSSGKIKIFGEDVTNEGSETRRRIGFVTHESFLYDELTVEENLHFYARLFSADLQNVQELIESLKLRRWWRTRVRKLSYGLKKRVNIARSLIHNPELILLDELFSGLDDATCDLLVDHFRNEPGKAVIVSSHSANWTRKLCKREITLSGGRIVQDTRL